MNASINVAGFEEPVNIGAGIVVTTGHILADNSPNCPACGAPPSEHHVKNYDEMWRDGDVVCKCGTRVRSYDAG